MTLFKESYDTASDYADRNMTKWHIVSGAGCSAMCQLNRVVNTVDSLSTNRKDTQK